MKRIVILSVYLTSNDVVKIKMDHEAAVDKLMNFESDNPLHNRMIFPGNVIDKKIITRMNIQPLEKEKEGTE